MKSGHNPDANQRGPGRPRASDAALNRELILKAALRIVDEHGIKAMTMRRLAADLGVNPMSIYHHLPGKAAVLSGLVELVFSTMTVAPPREDAPWQERIAAAAHAYRRAVCAHPNLALQIIADPVTVTDAVIVAGEHFYRALEDSGLPPRAIVESVDTLVDFVHGFVLGETSATAGTFDLAPKLLERVRSLPPGSAPSLTRITEALGEEGLRYDFDSGFETGVSILVAGIDARHRRATMTGSGDESERPLRHSGHP